MEKVFVVTKANQEGNAIVIGAFDMFKKAQERAYRQYEFACMEVLQRAPENDKQSRKFTITVNDMSTVIEVHGIELQRHDSFPISFLKREDLEEKGYDMTKVTDDDMETIASRMDKYYCEGYCDSFGSDLVSAADYIGIPEKED